MTATLVAVVSVFAVAQPTPPKKASPAPKVKTAPPRAKPRVATPPKPKTSKPKPAKPKLPPAPEACASVTDEIGRLLDAAIAPLAEEANKREDADLDRGVQAFQEHLAEHGAQILAARKRALDVEKTLSKDDRALCERRAYKVIHKSLTRFATVASFYHSRIEVFRALGDLFR